MVFCFEFWSSSAAGPFLFLPCFFWTFENTESIHLHHFVLGSGSCCAAQAGLELALLLPEPLPSLCQQCRVHHAWLGSRQHVKVSWFCHLRGSPLVLTDWLTFSLLLACEVRPAIASAVCSVLGVFVTSPVRTAQLPGPTRDSGRCLARGL